MSLTRALFCLLRRGLRRLRLATVSPRSREGHADRLASARHCRGSPRTLDASPEVHAPPRQPGARPHLPYVIGRPARRPSSAPPTFDAAMRVERHSGIQLRLGQGANATIFGAMFQNATDPKKHRELRRALHHPRRTSWGTSSRSSSIDLRRELSAAHRAEPPSSDYPADRLARAKVFDLQDENGRLPSRFLWRVREMNAEAVPRLRDSERRNAGRPAGGKWALTQRG